MSTLPMEDNRASLSADSRVAKLLEMAREANTICYEDDALKCYKAVLQLDPDNIEADFYIFLLTPYEVKVYDPHISEYYSNLISKFHALLKYLKEKNLSRKELRETIERTWDIIEDRCFSKYYIRPYKRLEKEGLLKEIQGHSIRLEAAEKLGDYIIGEYPHLEDIAVKVWGYEVGVIYQSIANLKYKTKYDPETIDIWERNKMTFDIYRVARKIFEINNEYLSPYTECPQEIKEFFEAHIAAVRKEREATEKKRKATDKKKEIFLKIFLTILVIALYLGLVHLFDGFIIATLFGGLLGILAIIVIWQDLDL